MGNVGVYQCPPDQRRKCPFISLHWKCYLKIIQPVLYSVNRSVIEESNSASLVVSELPSSRGRRDGWYFGSSMPSDFRGFFKFAVSSLGRRLSSTQKHLNRVISSLLDYPCLIS
ncbi:hypothetical protein Tco_0496445 [Tanacetum coccineum]